MSMTSVRIHVGLAVKLGFDLSVYREPLRGEADGEKARVFMDEKGVDFALNYLNQHDIPYKWFYGPPDSPAFLERLGVTLRFAPGAVTVSSLNNDFDNLFILTGEVLKKEGYAGSSGWLGGLRVNHHCPSARGDLTAELNEMAS